MIKQEKENSEKKRIYVTKNIVTVISIDLLAFIFSCSTYVEVSDKDHNSPNPFSTIDIIDYKIENQTNQPDSDHISLI